MNNITIYGRKPTWLRNLFINLEALLQKLSLAHVFQPSLHFKVVLDYKKIILELITSYTLKIGKYNFLITSTNYLNKLIFKYPLHYFKKKWSST